MTRQEEIRKKICELVNELEGLENERDWPPVFERGETNWIVTSDGDSCPTTWTDDNHDRAVLAFGNSFKSKAQAKWSAERDRLLRPALGPVMPSMEVLKEGWVVNHECAPSKELTMLYVDYFRHYVLGLWQPTKEDAERVRRGLLELIEDSNKL